MKLKTKNKKKPQQKQKQQKTDVGHPFQHLDIFTRALVGYILTSEIQFYSEDSQVPSKAAVLQNLWDCCCLAQAFSNGMSWNEELRPKERNLFLLPDNLTDWDWIMIKSHNIKEKPLK